jgi:hypothetical protein
MNLSNLKEITLIVSIIGILLLVINSYVYVPTKYYVSDIYLENKNLINKTISVSGTISNISIKENILFFNVCEISKCLPAVLFNYSELQKSELESAKSKNIEQSLTGKYTLYNNSPEIIIYKID